MALFTLEEFENITADQRKKNKNTDEQYLKNLRITKPTARETAYNRKAQATQSAPNRRTSGLPTEGEPVSEQEIYRKKVNTQPLTANSRVTSVETDNGNIIDVADIYGKNLFQTPNVNITEKLKKDLGADYGLFASQGIQGGNNPEYIGAFGENFKTGLKSFGRNILNTVDAIKSNNTKDARLIQAIERARREAPNNAEVEKGLQIAIKNQNPYEKQAAVEKQATEKVLQRQQKTRQENARNNETYGNLPGYGIVRGAGQLAGAFTPTIALNTVAPGLGSATYYTNAYGSAFAQSVGEGATYRQAKQYARLDTALEYARMHAYNTIRGLTPEGSLLGENGWRKVADKFVKTNTGRYLFKKTLDVTRAGRMAILDKVITPYLKRAVYDPDADLANMADVLNAFGGAALVTAVLGALNFKQEYNDINNGYRYTDTFTKDQEDINKWFKGVDNLEDAKRMHNAYVKSYADVRNSADVDPARLAELQEIENAFTSLKAQLKNKSARRSMATNEPQTATETAAEPQAGKNQLSFLPRGETAQNAVISGGEPIAPIAPTEEVVTEQPIEELNPETTALEQRIIDNGRQYTSEEIDNIFDSTAPTEDTAVPAEIQATEKVLQESGVKFSTADLDNAISGRQATKRYETVATKQPITPKTNWRDKLNEIIRGNGDNKEERLKRLKESVKSEPAKKAIQAEIDKISPNKEQVIKTGVQKNTYKPGIEKNLTTARSEKDTYQRDAARRLLTKRGIDWQTGEEMPVKLTAAQVDQLSHFAERDKRKNYPVYSNNGTVYIQDELLFEFGKDGKVGRMLTSKETGQIINDPNTIKVAKFNYQDTVVPFNQSNTKTTSEQPRMERKAGIQNSLKIAQSEDDFAKKREARYFLTKQGINWRTGKEMPIKLTAPQVDKLSHMVDVNRKDYYVFSNNGNIYYQNGFLYELGKDGEEKKALTDKETGKIFHNPNTVKIAKFDPLQGILIYKTQAERMAEKTATESQEADTKILQNSNKVIEKDIENFAKKNFTKSDRKIYLTDNGYTYLANGYYILRIEGEINEATIKSLNDNGYSFEKNEFGKKEWLKNFLELTPNDNLKIDMKPKYFPASGDKGDVPKYVFKVGKDKYWTVNKRYFDKLNNPGVRFMTVEKSDDKGRILQGAKAVDENGDVVGFVLPMRLNVENLKEFYESGEDVKGNFFKKRAPKSKATLEKEKAGRLQSQESEESIQDPTPGGQEKRVENSEINVSEREKETEKLQSLESEEDIRSDIERIDAENKNLENELENSTDEPDTDETITTPTATRAARYEIDEKTAKLAREMRSQRGYKAGEATSEYNEYLTKAEEIAKAAKEKNPAESERIDYLLNKYSQKIAQNINAVAANESKYPAWFVSGPARYNVKKNEALMRRTRDLFNQRESYEKILDKIQRIGNGTEAIKSSDANAVEKLTEKLEKFKRYHSQAKLANAYYKKNGSLEGFHPVGLTREQEKQMFEGARWMKEHYPTVTSPFNLTNSNAEIHRLEDRIKNIQSAKEAGNKEVVTNSNYRVVKNAEEMRLQYFFDGKPDRDVINIMKSNGFKWSPKNKAWQRQLTANAEYVGTRVNEALNKFYGESKPKEVRLNSMIPGGKQLESIAYALAKQIMPKNEKRAGELADLLTEIIQNEDSAPVVKEKLNKQNFYVSPQIIKKIQSFYGYEGSLPENTVEGEDPILFNIQKPIEPKGRMVKLGKKEQERYDDYAEFYGEIPEKKGGRREVKVPKKVDDENPNSFVSESAKTIMQSPAMTDEGAQTLKKAVLDGVFNYEKVANKEALEEANKTIEEKGYEEAYKQWQRVVEGKEQLDVKKIALGVELLNNAVNNNDASRMVEIASGLQMFSTLGAQITQFGNVWRDLTPNGRLYTAQTAVKYINQQQLEKINKGLAKEVTIPASLQEKLLNAGGNLKERERIMEEIQQSIADQLPGTWDEKLRGIRYLAMLGNPRTHIRNTVGNAAMIIPTAVKNVTGGLMEKLIPKSQRTKAPIKAIFAKKDVKKFINDEYEKYKPMIRGETKYDFKSGIRGKRKIYKTNILNKRSKFNSARLEKEDELFLGAHFKYQYRMAMAARGLTVNDLEKDEKLRLEIANIAAKEAQTNTYRDSNKLASKISGAKRWTLTQAKNSKTLGGKASWGALYTVEEGLLPFTNTPTNILKKGIEYSPVGLAYGVENVLREVKKGNMSASQAVDNLAKGLTGTGLVALGFYLASKGWIKGQGSSDKKQRAIDDLKGEQKNSLQIGDVSYTIDWSAPAIMPVLVGANIYQNVVETDGEVNPGVVIDNLISMADTITDMSLLQGVNSAIKAARYSDNAVGAIFANLTTNYATQYIPTLSGQVARTLDPVRRNAYFVDKNKKYKNLEVVKNKSLAKIPGASMSLTPYIDAWGNVEQKDSRLAAGLENFFSPGYVSKIKDDPVTNEVERLYHETGNGKVVPSTADTYFTVHGEKVYLNGEQWADYAQNKGKMSYDLVKSTMKDKAYKELSDDEKTEVIRNIYEYANRQAKAKLSEKYDNINYALEDKDKQREQLMDLGVSPAIIYTAYDTADRNGNGNGSLSSEELFNYLESREDIDLVQRMYMFNYLKPKVKNNPYGNISDYEDE